MGRGQGQTGGGTMKRERGEAPVRVRARRMGGHRQRCERQRARDDKKGEAGQKEIHTSRAQRKRDGRGKGENRGGGGGGGQRRRFQGIDRADGTPERPRRGTWGGTGEVQGKRATVWHVRRVGTGGGQRKCGEKAGGAPRKKERNKWRQQNIGPGLMQTARRREQKGGNRFVTSAENGALKKGRTRGHAGNIERGIGGARARRWTKDGGALTHWHPRDDDTEERDHSRITRRQHYANCTYRQAKRKEGKNKKTRGSGAPASADQQTTAGTTALRGAQGQENRPRSEIQGRETPWERR